MFLGSFGLVTLVIVLLVATVVALAAPNSDYSGTCYLTGKVSNGLAETNAGVFYIENGIPSGDLEGNRLRVTNGVIVGTVAKRDNFGAFALPPCIGA